MKIQINGTIAKINDTQTFASGTKARTFWLTEDPEPTPNGKTRENTLEFKIVCGSQAKYDNTAALDSFQNGDRVSFFFTPDGNVWQGKPGENKPPRCFVSLRVISKIEKLTGAPSVPRNQTPPPATPPADLGPDPSDMPF